MLIPKGRQPETCKHEWKPFKQSVVPDNPEYDRRHQQFYLKVLACTKCKKKQYIDLIVE